MNSALGRDFPNDAASWDARLRAADCSQGERSAFKAWRQASPHNQREYDRLQTLLKDLRASRNTPQIRSIREWAVESSKDKPARLLRRRHKLWAAAAGIVALLAASPWLLEVIPEKLIRQSGWESGVFMTAIGERSTISLHDDSTLVLNTNTQLSLDFSGKERRLALIRGQAVFNAASDAERPFVVVAGNQRIVAVGTVFDVRFEGVEVSVTLVEGVLDVAPVADTASGATPVVRLLAGYRLTANAQDAAIPPVIESVDTERATSWQTGRIFFNDTPLSEAIEEMNRYSTLEIALDDESLGEIRINGSFRSGRQINFVNALEAYFPLVAIHLGANLIVLRAN